MEHTKGKWVVSSSILVCAEDARIIANLMPAEIPSLQIGIKEAEANARRICQCVNSHGGLVEACKVAVLALTHDPINPKDIAFIEKQLAEAEKEV